MKKKKLFFGTTMKIDVTPQDLESLTEAGADSHQLVSRHGRRTTTGRIRRRQAAGVSSKYGHLLQCLYDAVLITDLQGNIRDANLRAAEFLACEAEQLAGMSILDIVCNLDADLLEQVRGHFATEHFAMIEGYCRRRDKTMFAAEIAVSLFGSEEPMLCFTLRDITERKLAEKELERHRHHLAELVEERTRQVQDAHLEILNRLGLAVKFRDQETAAHNSRMNHYCRILARAAGVGSRECELLFQASAMHDIGKIGVSDSILLKAGPLTSSEVDSIKAHPVMGSKLLSGLDTELFAIARTVALTHHENWDGSGYPLGLAGEQIPLFGRIAAICDVFDSLRSERCYKKAWSTDEAVQELISQKGKKFDPRLVDLFVANLPSIMAVDQSLE